MAYLSPVQREALGLISMLGRDGHTADSLRELIRIDAESEAALLALAQRIPTWRLRVRRAIRFRQDVLSEFNRMVDFQAAFRKEMEKFCAAERR